MGAWSFKMNMMKRVFCMFHKFHMKGPCVKAVVDGPTGPAMSGPRARFRPCHFLGQFVCCCCCCFCCFILGRNQKDGTLLMQLSVTRP